MNLRLFYQAFIISNGSTIAEIDIAKPNPKKEKFAHISTSMAGSCASLLKTKLNQS